MLCVHWGLVRRIKKTKKHLDEYNILWVPPTNYDIVIGLQGVGVSTLYIYYNASNQSALN